MTDMTQHQWFLFDHPVGYTERPAGVAAFQVLCPSCGRIWARCEPAVGRATHWVATHRRCPACGTGSLAGADWMTHPYAPFRLPYTLLLRELDIAFYNPDTYNP
jgi:hypothetical protein